MSKTDRAGIYCWAGPDTIRMIKLKFFNPRIDIESLMNSYDYDYIAEVRDKFGITDFWATYSWGFSDKSEQEQRKFLLDRVKNFKKAGVKLHAYVQGPNLVYSDFRNQNYFAKDQRGRLIAYYRGRKVTCLNNPEFVDYKMNLITQMCKEDFDGIFMDNMQMGQIPIPVPQGALPYTFAGCRCEYCQKEFYRQYGEIIPVNLEANPSITHNYLKFRVDSVNKFLSKVYAVTSKADKEFGTNSFDPKFDTEILLGVNLHDISNYQDYLLFENHSLPDELHNNSYISEPDIYTQAVALKDTLDNSLLRDLLMASTKLLFKPNVAGNSQFWAIKFRSFCIEIADIMSEAFPNAKSLFLYRNLDSYLTSGAKAFRIFDPNSTEWMRSEDENRPKYIPLLVADPERSYTSYTPVEFITLMWLSVMDRYLQLRKEGIYMNAIKYEDLIEDPQSYIRLIFRELGFSEDDVLKALNAFSRDSQEGSTLAKENLSDVIISDKDKQDAEQLLRNHTVIRKGDYILPGTIEI